MSDPESRPRPLLLAIAWLVFPATIVMGVGQFNLIPDLRLKSEGSTTTGTVVAREPAIHDAVVVRFSVNDVDHLVAKTKVAKPNPEKSTLAVGDPVVVYYLLGAPATQHAGSHQPRMWPLLRNF